MGLVRRIAVLIAFALFLAPAALLGTAVLTEGQADTSENRSLASWPAWDGSARRYTRGVDAFLSDRFGLRMPLIRLARDVRDNLGEDAPAVVRGRDPWLFLGELAYRDEFEGVGEWDAAQVERWAESLVEAREALAARGVPLIVTIAPDKARIYPEHVPGDWRQGGRRFKQAVLSHPAVSAFGADVEPAILDAKARGEAVYFARDTHWSPSGGAAAARVLLGRLDPEVLHPRPQNAPVADRPAERLYDLEAMLGEAETSEPTSRRAGFPALSGYSVTPATVLPDGTPERGALHTIVVTHDTDNGASGTLVIVGDSFADSMMPQLAAGYRRVVRIHHGGAAYTVGTDEILSYDPDAVLLMIVERSAHRKPRPLVVGPTVRSGG